MKNVTITTIASLTTAEIVVAYNERAIALSETEVKRFSDRKAAERRLAAILARFEEAFPADKEEKKAKRSAAEGIAASWKNPEIAEKRMTRNTVLVNGEEFESFRKAWAACGFDDKKHIKNRMALKQNGTLTVGEFKFELGEQY